MRVGIIGTNWGRTHCGTFRAAGCEIAVLVGPREAEVAAVAAAEGVPLARTEPDALDACDIVVVASPTPTHLGYLRRFARKPVFCEKPLLGTAPPPGVLAGLEGTPKFVNYPFPFLDSARALGAAIADGRLGAIRRILLRVGVRFPVARTPAGWFIDVAVHPLAWLLHEVGELSLVGHHVGEGEADVTAVLEGDGLQADVSLYALPREGIRIGLRAVGERAVADLEGGYRPAAGWWFGPLRIDDVPVTTGEYDRGEDVWYRANRRVVDRFCRVVRGEMTPAAALADGAFDLRRALAIESMLAPLLTA